MLLVLFLELTKRNPPIASYSPPFSEELQCLTCSLGQMSKSVLSFVFFNLICLL